MINIDFKQFIRDHTWFGWHVTGQWYNTEGEPLGFEWHYSLFWADRLWPFKHKRDRHPAWWLKIFPRLIK